MCLEFELSPLVGATQKSGRLKSEVGITEPHTAQAAKSGETWAARETGKGAGHRENQQGEEIPRGAASTPGQGLLKSAQG